MKARVCFRGLLSEILRNSSQFYKIRTGGWSREVLLVAKTKTVRKWELNTSDNFMNFKAEDFFVSQCHRHIYNVNEILSKIYTRVYVQ